MTVTILVGDARAVLATLPEKSVQCVITSPPYFGLRSYNTSPMEWGGDQSGACAHEWGEEGNRTQDMAQPRLANSPASTRGGAKKVAEAPIVTTGGAHCLRCGCWRGELGSEPTPEAFIANLVEVFAAVKRVLRDDGLLFCNLGDSYAGSGKGPTGHNGIGDQETRQGFTADNWRSSTLRNDGRAHKGLYDGEKIIAGQQRNSGGDLPAKNLLMMPARVALALQANGWILRSCMPWIKASAMPESVQDRPSSALEYVFLFSKKARYFYDATAVRQTAEYGRRSAFRSPQYEHNRSHDNGAKEPEYIAIGGADPSAGRAFRNTDLFRIAIDDRIAAMATVLTRLLAMRDNGGLLLDEDGDPLALDVNPAAFKESHFATFPPKLVEPLIKAGTSERGACPSCGTAWTRVVDRGALQKLGSNTFIPQGNKSQGENGAMAQHLTRDGFIPNHSRENTTTGWRPSCPCPPAEPIPQTVLDPFSGAGTTGLVASRLGRDYIGVELSPVYAAMSEARIRDDAPLLVDVVTAGAAEYVPLELFGEVS